MRTHFLNVSARKIGGLWFLKLGRITLMFCVSRPDRDGLRLHDRLVGR